MNTSTELVRLEVLVSRKVKEEIEKQAAQAKQPVKRYGGRVLSQKVQSFADAANSFLQLSIKFDAILGTLQANRRNSNSQQNKSQAGDFDEKNSSQTAIYQIPPTAQTPRDIINYLLANQPPG